MDALHLQDWTLGTRRLWSLRDGRLLEKTLCTDCEPCACPHLWSCLMFTQNFWTGDEPHVHTCPQLLGLHVGLLGFTSESLGEVGEATAPESCHGQRCQDLRHEYVASHVRVLGQALNKIPSNSKEKERNTKETSSWKIRETHLISFN